MSSESLLNFYSGKILFVTGGTGFMGRILLAKLMRMGNLKEILVLSRPKRGKSNKERISEILSGFLFQDIEKFDSKFKDKLRIINGDMEIEDLGISSDDREYIRNKVDIIIHGAATIRFDESLKKAIAINIRGTKNMLDIATEVKNLQNFIHISTAFSHCPRLEISEEFYKSPIDPRLALSLLNNFDEEFLNTLTPKLIKPWPNTYAFTKSIAEDIVRQYQNKIPIAVVRPSLVQSTFVDPVPGYIDTVFGFMGIGLGNVLGVLRVLYLKVPETCLNVIPVDCSINSILAVGCRKLTSECKSNVFNCVTKPELIHSFAETKVLEKGITPIYPSNNMVWFPNVTFVKSRALYKLFHFLYHFVPAALVDIILHFKGSKLNLKRIFAKIYVYCELYRYFMERTWKFNQDNMQKVYSKMSKADVEYFPTQLPNRETAAKYAVDVINGMKKFVLKETDEDLEKARRKYKILKIAFYLFWGSVYYSFGHFVYGKLNDNFGTVVKTWIQES